MDNHKIDKINAYRKLLETKKLPKFDPDADTGISKQISIEFEAWVEGQIAELLGEHDPSRLTPSEIEFLKDFVARAQQRATAPQSAPPTQNTTKTPTKPEPPSRPNPNAKPLRERTEKGSLLSHLQEMEDKANNREF